MTRSSNSSIVKQAYLHRVGQVSYKHNNLMAMRVRYWHEDSLTVKQNKQQLKVFLEQQQVFAHVSEQELHYFFFSLPSSIIMKAHTLGFADQQVIEMMTTYIAEHQQQLRNKEELKIKYRI